MTVCYNFCVASSPCSKKNDNLKIYGALSDVEVLQKTFSLNQWKQELAKDAYVSFLKVCQE